jgi:hypothetical protein
MPFMRIFRQCHAAMVLLAGAVALTACGGGWHRLDENRDARGNTFPANYRPEILAFMHVYLNDPTDVREAAISEPLLTEFGSRQRYVVCVHFNAKQSGGQYAGVKTGAALFRNGRFDQFTEQRKEIGEACDKADYKPFPELATLKR